MATPKPESDDCMREEALEPAKAAKDSKILGKLKEAVHQEDDKYKELRKLAKSYSPKSRRRVEELIKELEVTIPAKSISVLMTGKTGSGKSTLTNGILGLKIDPKAEGAKEGQSIKGRCTTEVQEYTKSKNGIEVIVWDSPGLQDGTDHQEEYLKQMKTRCSKVDFTMYCIRVAESRFVHGSDNPDVVAMQKLTDTFGVEFWENTIIVLTYANTLEAFHVEWDDLSKKEKAKAFNAKIKEWEEQIKEIMIQDITIAVTKDTRIPMPREIVDKIQIVPAGHYRKPQLPGIDFWLSNLWFRCIETIPTTEQRLALVKINENRFKREDEVDIRNDFKKDPEEQPIVVSTGSVKKMAAIGGVGGLAAGGGIGALIGGLVAGPIGLGVGLAIGVLAGSVAGGSAGGGIAAIRK